jgi:hypothetical protein
MSSHIHRNQVVELLGTPQRTDGSINEPREQREGSIAYNEKWIYEHLENDPSGALQRIVFWHRYDFVGTMIRFDPREAWMRDDRFIAALQRVPPRIDEPVLARNPPITPTHPYEPVSDFKGKPDLGGYVEESWGGKKRADGS